MIYSRSVKKKNLK